MIIERREHPIFLRESEDQRRMTDAALDGVEHVPFVEDEAAHRMDDPDRGLIVGDGIKNRFTGRSGKTADLQPRLLPIDLDADRVKFRTR